MVGARTSAQEVDAVRSEVGALAATLAAAAVDAAALELATATLGSTT
jgi:hypothetical protein